MNFQDFLNRLRELNAARQKEQTNTNTENRRFDPRPFFQIMLKPYPPILLFDQVMKLLEAQAPKFDIFYPTTAAKTPMTEEEKQQAIQKLLESLNKSQQFAPPTRSPFIFDLLRNRL